jgi:hypothetical protein
MSTANPRGGSRCAGVNFEILVHAGAVFNRNQRLQAYSGIISNLDSVSNYKKLLNKGFFYLMPKGARYFDFVAS